MLFSSFTNIPLKNFNDKNSDNRSNKLISSNNPATGNFNRLYNSFGSKLKATLNNNKNSDFHFQKPNLNSMSANKNHLSMSNKFKQNSSKIQDPIEVTNKFKDGKIVKRKAEKSKVYCSNASLLQCFNLHEKQKFQELLSQNLKPNVNLKNESENASNFSKAQSSFANLYNANSYQTYIRSSPKKIKDDNTIEKESNYFTKSSKNDFLIDSHLPNINNSNKAKISTGYSRRISLGVDHPSNMSPSIPITNIKSINRPIVLNKNISIIELDSSPCLNFDKIAKKRINQDPILLEEYEEENENVTDGVSTKSHNQILSANFTFMSKNSQLNVNNKNFTQNQKSWNERLNKNTPILQDILYKSQAKSNALALEEERYKFKKIQRLEKEKIDRDQAQKHSFQLQLEAFNLLSLNDNIIELIEEDEFPELTEDQERMIRNALNPNPKDEILVKGFNAEIARKDIQTLNGLNWLNDEIVNFYMCLICERSQQMNSNENNQVGEPIYKTYAFTTFFYPKLIKDGYSSLKRWTRKVDIFSHDFLLVPIHLGVHWCLAVIDINCKEIRYYDSMNGNNHECLRALRAYLKEEHADKKSNFQFNWDDWKCIHVKDVPQQMNGSDCGMFACKYGEYISRGKTVFNFNQSHMPYYRRRMVWEILNQKLL